MNTSGRRKKSGSWQNAKSVVPSNQPNSWVVDYLKLLFIRHAESIGNQQQRMQGWAEFELSERGKHQAKTLASRLAAEQWRPTHVYSSPLKRAQQTTEILLHPFLSFEGVDGAPSIALELVDNLREFQTGVFQGLTWAEAQAAYPDLCDQLETSLDWIPIPGAETLQAGRDRAHNVIQSLLDRHANGDRVWIITHHWILQQLIATLLGSDRTWAISIPPTALFEFWLDRDRWHYTDQTRLNTALWQIQRFNDAHPPHSPVA
ncbi:MAG: histidine phosphatase family protein [Leptolyngbyaceae cyanobacterium SL_7_1]|nr:histidine phosphatase family protein [Leptolyngbyaceae cyanobacterium SL_7_1]